MRRRRTNRPIAFDRAARRTERRSVSVETEALTQARYHAIGPLPWDCPGTLEALARYQPRNEEPIGDDWLDRLHDITTAIGARVSAALGWRTRP